MGFGRLVFVASISPQAELVVSCWLTMSLGHTEVQCKERGKETNL